MLTAIGDTGGPEGTPITFTASAADSDDPVNTLTYSLDAGAPSGATINSSTGAFSWTPGELDGGTLPTVTIRVTDNGTPTLDDFETITINVSETNTAPVLTAIGDTGGPEGTPITFTASASDSDDPVNTLTYSLDPGAPSGAAINSSSGVFSWTPSEAQGPGVYPFTVVVTDNGAPVLADSQVVTLTVTEVNQKPDAIDDAFDTVVEDSSNNILYVLANDTDGDLPANVLTVINVIPASKGTVTIGPAGAYIIYTPNPNANGSDLFAYTISDGQSGGTDTGLVTVTITAVNDAPVATPQTPSVVEDTATPITLTGSDVEGSPLTYSIVTQPSHGALSGSGATRTYTPAANYNGADSFTFKVYDGAEFSTPATVSITVTPVNDAPAGTNKAVTILEDASKTFASIDFGFSDVNDTPANAFSAVKITTLPAQGSLKLNGVAVSTGQLILAANIPQLVFAPAANGNGTGYASFTFQVQDNGGGVNALDPIAKTMTINVTSVNDAPAGTNKAVTILEDASKTFASIDFGFSDVNDTPANAFSAVKITTLPAQGSLKLNGVAVSTGQLILAASIPQLVFTPAANGNGTGYASFTFQVQDNGGTLNSGVALDPTPNTMTFNVTAVNDEPVGVADFYAVNATTVLPLSVAAPGVLENDSDIEGSSLTASLNTQAAHGTATVNGDGSFTYNPTAGYAGTDSFTYTLSDGTLPVVVQVNLLIDKVAPPVAQWLSPVTALAGSSSYYGITYDASTATVPLKVFVDSIADVAKVEFRWYDHTQTPGVWQIIGSDETPTLESGKNVYTASLNMDLLPFTDQIQVWAYTYDAAGNFTRIVKVNGFDYWSRFLVNHNPSGYNVFLPFVRR